MREIFAGMESSCYLCAKKQELGKWLMDIAKYFVTAMILTSAFGDLDKPWVIGISTAAALVTLIFGLLLVRKDRKEE